MSFMLSAEQPPHIKDAILNLMNQKGLAPILIIFLLAGTLLGGYLVYQNQTKFPNQSSMQTTLVSQSTQSSTPSTIPFSPEQVTESFYKTYLNCIENHFQASNGRSPRENCPFRSSNISDYLTQILENAKAHDPILCATNTPVSINVDKAVIDTNKASVMVHTFYGSGDNPIKVELTKGQAGFWQITTIICSL